MNLGSVAGAQNTDVMPGEMLDPSFNDLGYVPMHADPVLNPMDAKAQHAAPLEQEGVVRQMGA
jgi:hypothetical protein